MEKQVRAEGSKAKSVLRAGEADINLEITTIGFLGAWGMFVSAFCREVNVGPIAVTWVVTAHCL